MTDLSVAEKLLVAARNLLSKRYRDGECDAVALSSFEDEITTIAQSNDLSNCAHTNITTKAGDETFLPRRGCLDCDQWLDSVRVIIR